MRDAEEGPRSSRAQRTPARAIKLRAKSRGRGPVLFQIALSARGDPLARRRRGSPAGRFGGRGFGRLVAAAARSEVCQRAAASGVRRGGGEDSGCETCSGGNWK